MAKYEFEGIRNQLPHWFRNPEITHKQVRELSFAFMRLTQDFQNYFLNFHSPEKRNRIEAKIHQLKYRAHCFYQSPGRAKAQDIKELIWVFVGMLKTLKNLPPAVPARPAQPPPPGQSIEWFDGLYSPYGEAQMYLEGDFFSFI